jgi:predicted metal-dependent hydrolase
MPVFQFGTTTIPYSIDYRPNKKGVVISLGWQEGMKVIAPKQISQTQIEEILAKKASWIIEKYKEISKIAPPPAPKEFVSGEKFSWLGRSYRLKVHKVDGLKKSTLTFRQGKFIAQIPKELSDEERKQQLSLRFKEWYCTQGLNKIQERLQLYCPKMGVQPTKVVLKEQKRRWGTCTSKGAIYLNWRLLMAPLSIVDYVLVHELAHLKHFNHSKAFWHFVQTILPDYEERKEWLKINGPTLTL